MFLYRYEVAKTKIGRANKAFICPKFQNTVSNFAKCNSVTFLKSFRFSQFLSSMVMLGTYHIYLSVVKSNDSKKQIAPFLISIPSFRYSKYRKCSGINVTLLQFKFSPKNYSYLIIPDNSQLHQLWCGCKIFQVRGFFSILNATRTPLIILFHT